MRRADYLQVLLPAEFKQEADQVALSGWVKSSLDFFDHQKATFREPMHNTHELTRNILA